MLLDGRVRHCHVFWCTFSVLCRSSYLGKTRWNKFSIEMNLEGIWALLLKSQKFGINPETADPQRVQENNLLPISSGVADC